MYSCNNARMVGGNNVNRITEKYWGRASGYVWALHHSGPRKFTELDVRTVFIFILFQIEGINEYGRSCESFIIMASVKLARFESVRDLSQEKEEDFSKDYVVFILLTWLIMKVGSVLNILSFLIWQSHIISFYQEDMDIIMFL